MLCYQCNHRSFSALNISAFSYYSLNEIEDGVILMSKKKLLNSSARASTGGFSRPQAWVRARWFF